MLHACMVLSLFECISSTCPGSVVNCECQADIRWIVTSQMTEGKLIREAYTKFNDRDIGVVTSCNMQILQ